MTAIETEVQKLETDNIVILYQLDTTPIGGTMPFYFTKRMYENSYVSFGGIEYAAIDITASGFLYDGRGAFPTPTLQVSNINNLLTAIVVELKDLCGARLTRIRTFEENLDNGSDPDPGAMFPPDIYQIEQKTRHNRVFIEWKLSSILDQTGRQIPARTMLRDVCTHRYRIYNPATDSFDYSNATCPYVGTAYFDENDLTVPKNTDACSKRLSGCRKRFGQNGELPIRAFPGISRVRIK
ncbi:minor tail protein [Rhizobium phage vB_RglS_P106B]|uniref:Minor tail protein n=1 Tax=Rhizobium phage vB_RglS_P106B TaxID=1458697 RepID=W6EC15_9CAUD|nr:minor tail protein [Rhizobium phage vB_RglS_P106B]AHJ10717.1 minor tail protein [Rhizobium phage vB_RglS_P106B]